jgi:NADPH2:quinone reductase
MKPSYASALGATVIAAAGSQSKLDICKMYGGADYTVNYTVKDWQKEVLRMTGGRGVDVVYDPVGRVAGELLLREKCSELILLSHCALYQNH